MKKIFALLLAMTMMLCVSGAMAEHSGWTALPDGMTTLPDGMKTLSDGKYYLPNDINLGNKSLLINGDVTLCLCSRTLTGSGIFVINIQDGAHLTLQDCGANNSGCILQTWENNAIAGVGGKGRFTMHGGTVKGMNYGISTHSAPQISAGTIEGKQLTNTVKRSVSCRAATRSRALLPKQRSLWQRLRQPRQSLPTCRAPATRAASRCGFACWRLQARG